jgi:peptidylprolyl isomerase
MRAYRVDACRRKVRGRLFGTALAAVLVMSLTNARSAPPPVEGPRDIVAAAAASDWRSVAPENLLLLDLANGGRVAIELAEDFTPAHVANLRAFVRAKWFDGGRITRVQDNYVAQWAGADDGRPLPAAVAPNPPREVDRPLAGLNARFTNWRDGYAARVGYAGGRSIASDGTRAWLTHCYGMVGVGRSGPADSGSGVELYAVIGQAPRQIDRNIAIVGRAIAGMPALAGLPRGSGARGEYEAGDPHIAIKRIVLASDLPAEERPHYEVMRTDTATFASYLLAWAHGHYGVIGQPAGGADVCNAAVPARSRPRE